MADFQFQPYLLRDDSVFGNADPGPSAHLINVAPPNHSAEEQTSALRSVVARDLGVRICITDFQRLGYVYYYSRTESMPVAVRFPRRVVRNGDSSSHRASIAAGIYLDNARGLNFIDFNVLEGIARFLGDGLFVYPASGFPLFQ